jgi:hypothetical protein
MQLTWVIVFGLVNIIYVNIVTYQYSYGKGRVWYALITFLYVDILGAFNSPNI